MPNVVAVTVDNYCINILFILMPGTPLVGFTSLCLNLEVQHATKVRRNTESKQNDEKTMNICVKTIASFFIDLKSKACNVKGRSSMSEKL